ncbi:NlpC/P60 family protein [Clostridium sediminicola]|uniref:C40 family peptidase n=1 Tax=Clostridium sediminicola TaxID=3114879 RepID=UPI0031F1C8C1
MRKRLTATVLTTIILISSTSSVVVLADTLQQKLDKQYKELKDSKNKLSSAKKTVEELESKIEEFDYEIENTMFEIDELNNKIETIEVNIENAAKDIGQAEKDMINEKVLYNDRITAMYISGKTGFVEILLGAKGFHDLYSRIQIIRTITELDNEIIASLKRKKAEVEKRKKIMEEETEKLDSSVAIYKEKMVKLEANKTEQQKYINEARKQVTAYANAVSQDQKDITKTKKLIEQARAKTSTYVPSRGSSKISSSAVIAYASNFLGRPYRWGATGPSSFDCSGFTQYVFRHFGVKIPRVSRDQAKAGKYVPKSQLKPGDLVFFAKRGRAVHHVGIYVGNNSYIHAPRTGDVIKISRLSSRSDYYTARRFF